MTNLCIIDYIKKYYDHNEKFKIKERFIDINGTQKEENILFTTSLEEIDELRRIDKKTYKEIRKYFFIKDFVQEVNFLPLDPVHKEIIILTILL